MFLSGAMLKENVLVLAVLSCVNHCYVSMQMKAQVPNVFSCPHVIVRLFVCCSFLVSVFLVISSSCLLSL